METIYIFGFDDVSAEKKRGRLASFVCCDYMGRRKIAGTLVGIGKILRGYWGIINGVFGVFQKGRFV